MVSHAIASTRIARKGAAEEIVKFDPATRRTLIGHSRHREIRTFYKADGRQADPFQAAKDLARKLNER
jgi:hypothetical protein